MPSNNYIAVDLGATSGRLIVSHDNELTEIHRFKDYLKLKDNHYVWDIDFIFNNIIEGLKIAFSKYKDITSMSIDSWGVDYVLLNKDKVIKPVYSYRDSRVDKCVDKVHSIIPFKELYEITGSQFTKFNSIYQLKDDLDNHRLDNATDYLAIPEFLSYLLTGKKAKEYTMASTSGMLDLSNNEFSKEIITKLKFPKHLFPKLVKPGYVLGEFKKEIVDLVGGNTKVILCASHDTASAFEAVDVDKDTIILSSGTWSLIGVKIPKGNNSIKSYNSNFTNEGGVNYIRYLKNIMGMWIFNEVKRKTTYDFKDINDLVDKSTYEGYFNVNDSSLVAPLDMKEAILELLKDNPPKDDGDLFRSIYNSLSMSYLKASDELNDNLDNNYTKICVVGGGAKNTKLNEFIERITKRKVIAMPIEATAIGNIKVQKGVKLC